MSNVSYTVFSGPVVNIPNLHSYSATTRLSTVANRFRGVWVHHGTLRHLNLHTCLPRSQALLTPKVSTTSSQDDTLHTLT